MFGQDHYGGDDVFIEKGPSSCVPDLKEVKKRMMKEQVLLEDFLDHMVAAAMTNVNFDYGRGNAERNSPRLVLFAQVGGAYLRIRELEVQIKEQDKRIKESSGGKKK